MECEYGCGLDAKYELSNGKWCCCDNFRKCVNVKRKNSEGLKKAYIEGRKKINHKLDEYRNWAKGLNALNSDKIKTKCNKNEIFIENSKASQGTVKKWLLKDENFIHKCQICGNTEWLGKLITLELDHINGNIKDNRKENLRFICPNCHSQTETWKKRNSKRCNKNVSDEDLIQAIIKESNIRKALESVGLTGIGRNYKRCYELLLKINFDKSEIESKIRTKRKIIDIDEKLLLELLPTNSLEAIGKKLGYNDGTIRHYCKTHNIPIPTIEERQKNHLLNKK